MADETVSTVGDTDVEVPVAPTAPEAPKAPVVDAYGFRLTSILHRITEFLVNGGGKDKYRREVIDTIKTWNGRTDGCVQAELHRVLVALRSKGVDVKLARSPRRTKPKAAPATATVPATPTPTPTE